MTHVLGGDFPFFCKTLPLKLLHDFIVGSHPILMEENLVKISRDFKVAVFPMSFIYLCSGIQPNHINGSN